ncbi:MAG: c-type cytochrome [Flavobacteriales bacterium]|nr:c-type cytochrome [Flavobacteriales bacterium]
MNIIYTILRKVVLGLSLFFFLTNTLLAQDGAKIFKANCATCHSTCEKKGTGPGLKGFWDRIPGDDDEGKGKWLVKWVKNPAGVIASGDDYAVALRAEYPTLMTAQGHLSDEEILAVATYLRSPEACGGGGNTAGPSYCDEFAAAGKEKEESSTGMYWIIAIVVVFFILANALGGIRRNLQNTVNDKEGKDLEPDLGWWKATQNWILSHKLQTGLIVLVLAFAGSVEGWYALKGIGVYQGYAPEQPIKFSHKIHAGENKIACVYCHHSAEKGKTAGIPSVNVCMNCHKGISEGSCSGETEIAKIYEAAGWNPEEQRYDRPQKPIKWVRIHNLPDFAYFNHSQHVIVGEQKCQTCHGPVEEMHLLEQHSELTMGWCIDCHRKTNVAMTNSNGEVKNDYYQKMYDELVEMHKAKGLKTFQVKDIGGLECGKCHY